MQSSYAYIGGLCPNLIHPTYSPPHISHSFTPVTVQPGAPVCFYGHVSCVELSVPVMHRNNTSVCIHHYFTLQLNVDSIYIHSRQQ